jgi:DUF1009 family protein
MSGPLGIIAGAGDLPRRTAELARAAGREVVVLGVSGFADPDLVSAFGGQSFGIGETGRQVRFLKDAGCEDIVFAGVVQRPDFSQLTFDEEGLSLLPALKEAAGKGDDALLRVVLGAFSAAGLRIIGAEQAASALLAPSGVMGRHAPGEGDWRDIRRAAKAAEAIGALDIGQGAVSAGGIVLALEAQEGTDHMLARCAALPPAVRGQGGVLVKRPKPIQDARVDLPTIGEETVRRAAEGKLSGLAVLAGGALIVNRPATIALADQLGLFIYGFRPEEVV